MKYEKEQEIKGVVAAFLNELTIDCPSCRQKAMLIPDTFYSNNSYCYSLASGRCSKCNSLIKSKQCWEAAG